MTEKERHPDEALFDIGSDLTDLQEQFGGAFTQEEAEAISAGFDGDVQRASSLYKDVTDSYVTTMTVEDLIKAGKSRTMAGNIKNKPNLKKTYVGHQRLDEAIEAKTTHLSDEFKHQISEVSGQNKARENPLAIRKRTLLRS